MASRSVKTLGVFLKPTLFDEGTGRSLPEAYRKFYREWKESRPAAVHYIPETENWRRDEVTGQVLPVQDTPLPLMFPKEHHHGLWGGEAVVQGFQKRHRYDRRVPHFWVPRLKRSVVYSEVLNKHISVVITDRAIDLINSEFGFDHYILKTPACDLKSLLALRIKRHLLKELLDGCPAYTGDHDKQKEIYDRYKQYLTVYTPEEVDWYGYSFREACRKYETETEAQAGPEPLKSSFRSQLIEKLKAASLKEVQDGQVQLGDSTSWLEKINIFSKKHP